MNSFKTPFNSLVFKILTVLSICAVSNLTKLSAQQIADTNYTKVLYDSAKVCFNILKKRKKISFLFFMLLY